MAIQIHPVLAPWRSGRTLAAPLEVAGASKLHPKFAAFAKKKHVDFKENTLYYILVGGIPTILKNMSSSMGRIIPYIANYYIIMG